MAEYLIRRIDGEWFDLQGVRLCEALRPYSFSSERVEGWGDWRIRIEGAEFAFSYEDPGIQVIIEGDLPTPLADRIVDEIRQNIERVSGQGARVEAI